ncbi:hypothetical protein LCGC14_1104130 [marine sediment metagenome]|uniref:Uncharacterized protein n=1 Tax=marine sediment metagenome TaxID=412755 RepID=A0A0F9PRU1_9ZZZZ
MIGRCGGCIYLKPTEREQNKDSQKPNHICTLYNKRVIHGYHHPSILKLRKCTEENSFKSGRK